MTHWSVNIYECIYTHWYLTTENIDFIAEDHDHFRYGSSLNVLCINLLQFIMVGYRDVFSNELKNILTLNTKHI